MIEISPHTRRVIFSLRRSRTRRRILVALRLHGPCTVSELAAILGMKERDIAGAIEGTPAYRPWLSLFALVLVEPLLEVPIGHGPRWNLTTLGERWSARIRVDGEIDLAVARSVP